LSGEEQGTGIVLTLDPIEYTNIYIQAEELGFSLKTRASKMISKKTL
jgi:hypothetical protein